MGFQMCELSPPTSMEDASMQQLFFPSCPSLAFVASGLSPSCSFSTWYLQFRFPCLLGTADVIDQPKLVVWTDPDILMKFSELEQGDLLFSIFQMLRETFIH